MAAVQEHKVLPSEWMQRAAKASRTTAGTLSPSKPQAGHPEMDSSSSLLHFLEEEITRTSRIDLYYYFFQIFDE